MNHSKMNTNRAPRRFSPRLASTLATAACSALVAAFVGCGGSGSGSGASAGRAQLAVTVKWPQPSGRLIPAASQSIRANLTAGSTTLGTQLLVRPAQSPFTTTVTFDNLQAGAVTLTATAYPNADGSGNAQAVGSVPATLTSGQQSTVSLTMATTIKTLSVAPATPSVAVGSKITLTATAYDASNNVVLVSPANISWTPTTSTAATASPATGQTTTVSGVATGSQVFTATEAESKISGNTTVTVTPAQTGGCTPGPVTGPGFLASSAWPKAQGASLRNNGKSSGGGAKGVLKWTATIGKGGQASATLGPDGTLYVGSYYDNTLYAINSSTGKLKWTFVADSGTGATPAVSNDGSVYFGSTFYFYALNAATGTMKWKVRADVSSAPTIGLDGTIYAGGANSYVAYDPATGKILWDSYHGIAGWPAFAPPIAADGTLYGGEATASGGQFYSMDGKCGSDGWRIPLNESAFALGADGTIYATADYSTSANTRVVAVNPTNGAIKWSAPNVPIQPTPPAIDDAKSQLYVLSPHGLLTALSMVDGSTKWSYQAPQSAPDEGTSIAAPSIGSDGTVYFAMADGGTSALYAVDPGTGKPKWTYSLPGYSGADSTTPTVGPDGTIYFVDERNGTLYAIK